MINQKRLFLYALILTLLVFNFGIFMGYMLESSRMDKVNKLYYNAEVELIDQMIQKDSLDLFEFDCEALVKENSDFGDRIFEEAQLIQRYEEASRISKDILVQHKRFDLLRTLFWMNSIKIKQKCATPFHTVVYLYKYNSPSMEQEAEQKFISNLLGEIKEKFGDSVMLIPIAADNDIPSLNLLVSKYDVNELPAILIDEEILVNNVKSLDDVERYFN